jgi:hypothetical protein
LPMPGLNCSLKFENVLLTINSKFILCLLGLSDDPIQLIHNSFKTRSKKFSGNSLSNLRKKLDLKSSHFPCFYISAERSILGLFKTGHIKVSGGAVSELWASKEDQVKA